MNNEKWLLYNNEGMEKIIDEIKIKNYAKVWSSSIEGDYGVIGSHLLEAPRELNN